MVLVALCTFFSLQMQICAYNLSSLMPNDEEYRRL